MNKDVLKRWIKALRSGDFKQARGQLAHTRSGTTSYCCLGVLCELAADDQVVERTTDEDGIRYDRFSWSVPPPAVEDWLGTSHYTVKLGKDLDMLSEDDGSYTAGEEISLIRLNDGYRFSFDQIADALEATYLADELVSVE